MTIAQLIAFFAPFKAALIPELIALEAQGYKSLEDLIDAKITSPDLHVGLQALAAALDKFAQYEIKQLGT
jgi:hypothetical protein